MWNIRLDRRVFGIWSGHVESIHDSCYIQAPEVRFSCRRGRDNSVVSVNSGREKQSGTWHGFYRQESFLAALARSGRITLSSSFLVAYTFPLRLSVVTSFAGLDSRSEPFAPGIVLVCC